MDCRYQDAVVAALKQSQKSERDKLALDFKARVRGMSMKDARLLARSFGVDPLWNSDFSRTKEGYLRIQGGTEYCIARSIAFAPYCDLVWMESAKPHLRQA